MGGQCGGVLKLLILPAGLAMGGRLGGRFLPGNADGGRRGKGRR